VTVRPERGAILHDTYGFEGAEGDLRSGRLVIAGELTPQAARMRLLAQLGESAPKLDRAHASSL
jgi:L-asparaginase